MMRNPGHKQAAFWMLWSLLWIYSTGCDQSTDPKQQSAVVFVEIPPGEFLMGAEDPAEFGTYSAPEGPQHRVRLTRSFQMSRCEITVGEFRRFVDATGYVTEAEETGQGCNGLNPTTGEVEKLATRTWLSPGFEQSDDHPVVCVSHRDAERFCEWLSREMKAVVRLPTEAEWEYCCRAGTRTRYSSGDAPESLEGVANCGDRALAAKFAQFESNLANWNDGHAFTAPVGKLTPNGFGLCDMHGNVGEWCSDWFDAEYYVRSEETNPVGPASADLTLKAWHVVRGGSWYNAPVSLRSSGRHDGVPTEASTTNGFRVVKE